MNYLMDLERTIKSGIATYWKSNKHGYTTKISSAGLYSDKEAQKIAKDDFDNRTVVISQRVVDNIK